MSSNHFKIFRYFKQNKFGCSLYVFMTILVSVPNIFTTILMANAISDLTLALYKEAIIKFAIMLGIDVVWRIAEYLTEIIYNKYSTKIMSEINCDLADQAFKLTSSTFSQYNTGTFVQRIVSEPQAIVDYLANLIETFTSLTSFIVIWIYIMTLNVYISLILLFSVVICGVLEYFRLKILKKSRMIVKKESDEIYSLTNEIVKSEKDVKTLSLESKLSTVSKQKFETFKKSQVKKRKQDLTLFYVRTIFLGIISFSVLILGVYFVDISLLTFASFMIIYSNNKVANQMIFSVGRIGSIVTEIKISLKRITTLFDNEKFECEKFGNVHLETIEGNITYKNVAYRYKNKKIEEEFKPKKALKKKK